MNIYLSLILLKTKIELVKGLWSSKINDHKSWLQRTETTHQAQPLQAVQNRPSFINRTNGKLGFQILSLKADPHLTSRTPNVSPLHQRGWTRGPKLRSTRPDLSDTVVFYHQDREHIDERRRRWQEAERNIDERSRNGRTRRNRSRVLVSSRVAFFSFVLFVFIIIDFLFLSIVGNKCTAIVFNVYWFYFMLII